MKSMDFFLNFNALFVVYDLRNYISQFLEWHLHHMYTFNQLQCLLIDP